MKKTLAALLLVLALSGCSALDSGRRYVQVDPATGQPLPGAPVESPFDVAKTAAVYAALRIVGIAGSKLGGPFAPVLGALFGGSGFVPAPAPAPTVKT